MQKILETVLINIVRQNSKFLIHVYSRQLALIIETKYRIPYFSTASLFSDKVFNYV